jgi:RNA polymerase sigma-70 factor, ECF subfamily
MIKQKILSQVEQVFKRPSAENQTLFEKITFEHIDSLYGTALRLTRNKQDAEDLVQDACLRGFQYFHKYEQGSNFKAWIFKILMNTFINKYHKNKRTPPSVQFEKVEYSIDSELKDDDRKTILTDGNVFKNMFDDEIVHAIETIPKDYRVAVLLCDIENFTYKEMSDILEIPLGTVMSRISRGRKMLQISLLNYAKREGYIAK